MSSISVRNAQKNRGFQADKDQPGNTSIFQKKGEDKMLILGNGRVVTRDADRPCIENGAVAIDGTEICRVGGNDELKAAYPDAEYIDAKGGLIMPAFINVHEHIYCSFARVLSIKVYDPK